jgi:hypothetical protein
MSIGRWDTREKDRDFKLLPARRFLPNGMGFDYFYDFVGSDASQWHRTCSQVDVQTGLHLDDRDDRSYRDRRGYDSNATVGVGPGGVTIGPRQRCHMETTTIERDDGRRITRRERRCD